MPKRKTPKFINKKKKKNKSTIIQKREIPQSKKKNPERNEAGTRRMIVNVSKIHQNTLDLLMLL
jgi:hypothetical protein